MDMLEFDYQKPFRAFKVGDKVRYKGGKREGEIVSVNGSAPFVIVHWEDKPPTHATYVNPEYLTHLT